MTRDELAPAAVLMVDDHPPNLIALAAVLEPLGHQLISAHSGAEAVELATGREFAVIVMDVAMPILDGIQTAHIIKQYEASRYVPIIFLTAMDREGAHMFRAYQSGAVDYLVKPYEPAVLRSKVSVFVELYQQRRKIEDQQQQLQKERLARVAAEAAAQAREELLAVVSHELTNPVAAIENYASLLLHRTADIDDATVRKYAMQQFAAAEKMERLIGDLLTEARAERGALEIVKKPHPISELVDHLTAVMLPLAQQKSQILTSELPPVACTLCCDRDRIYQVLANLVGNAIKFTPKNGSIRLTVEALDDEVIFSVKDSGPGILPDEVPHVFDRYWHAPPSKQGGLGLGLAVAKEIVHAHEGRIWLECQPGGGSTFHAAFPGGPRDVTGDSDDRREIHQKVPET